MKCQVIILLRSWNKLEQTCGTADSNTVSKVDGGWYFTSGQCVRRSVINVVI